MAKQILVKILCLLTILLLSFNVLAIDEFEDEYYDEEEEDNSHHECNDHLSIINGKNCTKNKVFKLNNGLSVSEVHKNLTKFKIKNSDTFGLKNNTDNDIEEYDYDYDQNPGNKNNVDALVDSIYDENENTSSVGSVVTINSTFNKLNKLYLKLYENIKPVEQRLKQRFLELISTLELPNDCFTSFARINDGLGKGQLWALKFFDSTGSLPSGLTEGVFSSFGEYEQCLDIESSLSAIDNSVFYGKYCLAKPVIQLPTFEALENFENISFLNEDTNKLIKSELKKNLNTFKLLLTYNTCSTKLSPFRIGLCIPSTCDPKDIGHALNKILYPIARIPLEVGPECHVKHENIQLNTFQLVLLIVFIIQLILVTISTTIAVFLNLNTSENRINSKKFDWKQIVISFSIIESNKTLFSQRKHRLLIVDTLMLFYFVWIIVSQYYLAPITIGFIGYKKIFNSFIIKLISEKKYFWLRTFYPKDSIFLLSGVMIAYDFFGHKSKVIKLSEYPKFILEKWLRFSLKIIGPLIVLNLMSLSGDGPIWHLGQQFFVNTCQKNFWQSFLFANNYVEDLGEICNAPSFVISVIFQLQIISPLLMIPLKLWPTIGFILNFLLIIFGCFLTIITRFLFGLKLIPYEVSEMYSLTEMKRSFVRFSITTDQNLSVFVIGIIVGYLLRNRSVYNKFFNQKYNRILLSIFCPVLCVLAIIWGENFKDINESANKINLILWFASGKILWSLGNSWIIYALYTGSKGFLYRLLTSQIFLPLTRLSFGICLVNNMVINYRLFTRRENFVLNQLNVIQFLIIDLLIMLTIAYGIYVLVECPFVKLIEIFKKTDRKEVNNNSDDLIPNQMDIVNDKTKGEVELKFIFPVD